MKDNSQFDVAIIGGGPAGAAAATLLARAGHDVAVFEARAFPRFHVGESLVPACNFLIDRLGLSDAMDAAGFPRKHGVQFFLPNGPTKPFYFSETENERMHHTWQVLRSDFDKLMFDHAEKSGAQTFRMTQVTDVTTEGNTVTGVRVRKPDRTEATIDAKIVIDASGQRGLLAQRLGRRRRIPGLANLAIYAHYRDFQLDEGIDAGSTIIYRLDNSSWFWQIPLPDSVSVGLVIPAAEVSALAIPPAAIFDQAIESCAPLRERMANARPTTDISVVRDFSYRARRDGGHGWLLIGDALGFIDPCYSTGLLLSLRSAELAADTVSEQLRSDGGCTDFTGYSKSWQEAFDRFLVIVRAFYDGVKFGSIAKDPDLRRGLIDLLTGLVDTDYAIQAAEAIGGPAEEELPS